MNKTTGKKFGKSEDGAVWLDSNKTSPTQFYQFWVTCDDAGVEEYLKIYTTLTKDEIEEILTRHREKPADRLAQTRLAEEVTKLVHGDKATKKAQQVTEVLTGKQAVGDIQDMEVIEEIRKQIPSVAISQGTPMIDVLVNTGLATSKTEARRLLAENAIAVNGKKTNQENFNDSDFTSGRLLIRKGKAFKDSVLVELTN
jgi:tyrosyl-tRNA synthetase